MTRPRKKTVEYFPHMVAHGKTLYVLEEAYGNDGYAFWFKILETLGDTTDHYIDCRTLGAWSHLTKKANLQNGKAESIMGTLANVDAIDRELWEKCRVIWSQNFVDGLVSVYAKRKLEPPPRPLGLLDDPISDTQKELFGGFGGREPTQGGLSGTKEVEGVEERKESIGRTEVCSIPEILRGLELYESDVKLIANFTRNYNAWKKAYPHLDIDHQIRVAHCWEMDNPKRQKKNKARFLGGWLSREDAKRATRPDQSGRSIEDRASRLGG